MLNNDTPLSRKAALIAAFAIIILLVFLKIFAGQSYYDVFSVAAGMFSAHELALWFEQRKLASLLCGLAWGLLALGTLAACLWTLFG